MTKTIESQDAQENSNAYDDFGFNSQSAYDRTSNYTPEKPFPSTLQVVFGFAVIVMLVIYVSMGVLAGYYSWNEFPDDYILNKVIKSYMAVIFAPVYLIYVFLKVSLFNKPMK